MRALITGGGGQLAADLQLILGPDAQSFTHDELDITDVSAVELALADVEPDVVFNCAAFHNVDACEIDHARAWEVNVVAVRELARRSPYLIHISTNYVFDGRAAEPYREDDLPSPRSMYALTKLAGEHAVRAYAARALIVRTAGLYGFEGSASKGGNFVQRMIGKAREQGFLKMVADQRLQPTFTADLAAAIVVAAAAQAEGVVHLTASGDCSWSEFTAAILDLAGIDAPIEAVPTVIAPGSPDRPLNGVLARPAADKLGLPILRSWDEALADYMDRAALSAHALS
jgi:dTDP-4-dehydrorhamnose reductase